jgi:hypothetical protein
VRYLSLWFCEVIGISTQEFKSQYGSQPGRSACALATSNTVGIHLELWGRHGDWAAFKIQKRYTKKDVKYLLCVSLAAITGNTRTA